MPRLIKYYKFLQGNFTCPCICRRGLDFFDEAVGAVLDSLTVDEVEALLIFWRHRHKRRFESNYEHFPLIVEILTKGVVKEKKITKPNWKRNFDKFDEGEGRIDLTYYVVELVVYFV